MTSIVSCLACQALSCFSGIICNCFGHAIPIKKSIITRAMYALIFFGISIVAFIANNWSYKILTDIPVLNLCQHNDPWCIGALSVQRILFGLSAFHAILAVLLICVNSSKDPRSSLQDSWWSVKLLILIGLIVAAFFIPNQFFIGWGWVSLVGAFFFILIQLVLLIDCAYMWNSHWLSNYEEDQNKVWFWLFAVCTVVLYILSLALMILLWVFFYKGEECWMNVVFPTVNVGLMLLFSFLSVHSKVQESHSANPGLLQSAVVGLYCSYLVFSAATSEPNEGGFMCNPIDNTGGTFSTLLLGASFTIISVCFSTVRTATRGDDLIRTVNGSKGEESKMSLIEGEEKKEDESDSEDPKFSIQEIDEDDEDGKKKRVKSADLDDEEKEVKYNYSFFHLTFMLAAMFVIMLITNWQEIRQEPDNSYKVNHGFAAVWVKLASSWIVAALYIWSLIAPCLFPNREFR